MKSPAHVPITRPLRIHREQTPIRTEDPFNEVYDTGHVPCRLDVPGVTSVTHPKAQDVEAFPGGERKFVPRGETPGVPRDPRDRESP